MKTCHQTPTQTVLEHGESVQDNLSRISAHLDGDDGTGLKLPDWCYQYRKELLENCYGADVTGPYTVYHDCGKPYCRVVDDQGRQHFPDHAAVSKRVWLEAGGERLVGDLIGYDMCLHTMLAEEIPTYLLVWGQRITCTLLLVALSEIHSNAALFGGIESISFKTKFKQLDRRGRAITKSMWGDR